MPATTDYWVHAAHAEPLLFVTAPANEGLLAMMDTTLLPEVRRLVGAARRVTLIFDHEGWSPQRFRTWQQAGFDVITYRKGTYRDWPRRCFQEVPVEVSGRPVTYRLAERMVRLATGFRMREVRRLCDSGHQTAVVTTRRSYTTGRPDRDSKWASAVRPARAEHRTGGRTERTRQRAYRESVPTPFSICS